MFAQEHQTVGHCFATPLCGTQTVKLRGVRVPIKHFIYRAAMCSFSLQKDLFLTKQHKNFTRLQIMPVKQTNGKSVMRLKDLSDRDPAKSELVCSLMQSVSESAQTRTYLNISSNV